MVLGGGGKVDFEEFVIIGVYGGGGRVSSRIRLPRYLGGSGSTGDRDALHKIQQVMSDRIFRMRGRYLAVLPFRKCASC